MPSLRNVRQGEAVRVFLALGGQERRTKKNYRMVTMPNGALLAIPSGTLRRGLLQRLIRNADLTVEQFERTL